MITLSWPFTLKYTAWQAQKGEGEGEGEKHERGEREGSLPLSSLPPPFFPFPLSPIPFDATQATLKGTKRKQMAKRYDNHHYGVDACGLYSWHLVGSFRNITFFTYILYSVPVEPKLMLRLNTQTQNWENIATTVSLANIWWHITNTFILTSFITIKNKAP